MFELLYELPWREERFSPDEWLQAYLKARYGNDLSPEVAEAWRALEHTVYNAPKNYQGKGQSNPCCVPVRDFIWTEHRHGDMPSYSIHLIQRQRQPACYFLLQISTREIITLNMIWWTWCVRVWQIRGMCCLKKFPRVMTGKIRIASGNSHNSFWS